MSSIQKYVKSLENDITELDISDKNLTNLPDISRFTNLQILKCHRNKITVLPKLPDKLTQLICYSNELTELPELPEHLHILQCTYNNITHLPELNKNLVFLGCSKNLLTQLPTLPESLCTLRCDENQIESLPILPDNITHLYCNDNLLKKLPRLPQKLESFVCSNNKLTELPPFPPKLYFLQCLHNQLTSLPLLNDNLQVNLYGNPVLIEIFNAQHNVDDVYLSNYDPYGMHQYTNQELQQMVKIIYHFRYSYYCLKCKDRFLQWKHVRERERER
jgi:hypothetical protein